MIEEPSPGRMAILWSPEARIDLRSIDREPAMQILYCVDRYLSSGTGDVKKLKPPFKGFRLRCGEYRVFFDLKGDNTIEITGVRHRREAYR
jgi:mRNA-degrading endonuclease RelE of RelBE toxin-antitoxin system